MTGQPDNGQAPLDNLISIGSDIAGGAAGAAIGFFAAGPIGAVAGGAAGPIVTHTFHKLAVEIKQRWLGPREEIRLGATIAYAAAKIRENEANGQQIRQDDFFQEQPGNRSAAEEIAEGVLLVAQREHQERKLKFLGNLLANIVFRPNVDRDMANALVSHVERMSYRQICILSLIVRKDEFDLHTGTTWLFQSKSKLLSILTDIYGLAQQGILGIDPMDPPGSVFPTHPMPETGKLLFDLMELGNIDAAELEQFAVYLRSKESEKPSEGTEAAPAG